MKFVWDPVKNLRNIHERGIDFETASAFEWTTALILEDRRHDYKEPRFRAMGMLDGALHVLVFTMRNDDVRVISLRRANKREKKAYEKTQQN